MQKYFSKTDITVIALTLILFVISLFYQGTYQYILIEAAILLVSIKLIRIGYKNSIAYTAILKELRGMREEMKEAKKKNTRRLL